MTFAIHGSKNGERVVAVGIRPDAAVDKLAYWSGSAVVPALSHER
jgi:hypothetical protein